MKNKLYVLFLIVIAVNSNNVVASTPQASQSSSSSSAAQAAVKKKEQASANVLAFGKKRSPKNVKRSARRAAARRKLAQDLLENSVKTSESAKKSIEELTKELITATYASYKFFAKMPPREFERASQCPLLRSMEKDDALLMISTNLKCTPEEMITMLRSKEICGSIETTILIETTDNKNFKNPYIAISFRSLDDQESQVWFKTISGGQKF